MKKVLIALASVLAITAGCTKEEFKSVLFGETAKECPVKTITAAIENSDSKASLNFAGELPQMCWDEDDEVAVFGRTPAKASDTLGRAKFALIDGKGTPEGEFKYVEGDLGLSNVYYAVYPYGVTTKNSATTSSLTKVANDKITVEFPSKEKYNDKTLCAEGANIMIAKFSQTDTTDAPKFYFRNLCSYIEFYVDGPAEDKLQSAVIKSKDGSAINGIATCTFGDNDAISLEFDGKGTDAIVVTFYDAETQQEGINFDPGTPIDIALPPFINSGFTVTLFSVNGIETTVSSDAVLGRNTVTQFADPIVLDPSTIEPAASVADVEYLSFKAALAAANEMGEDCTIKLLRDCNITGVAEVSNANAVITLDLNGKTLTSVDVNRINVLAESKGFVIEDNSNEQTGTIKQENAGGNAVLSYGHLEINSGTIIGGLAAVYVYNGDLIVNGGTFKGDATTTGVITVNSSSDTQFAVDSVALRGGLVEASSRGLYFKGGCRKITFYDGFSVQAGRLPLCNTDCGITINGGEFHSDSTNPVSDMENNGGMLIHGGWFSTNASVSIVYGTKNQTFVDGGYFSRNVGADYVKEGYQSQGCDTTHNGVRYLYQVVPQASQQAVLTVEGEDPEIYSDGTKALLDAVAAGKDCEVKLLATFTINKGEPIALNAGISHTITVDLNGFTLGTSGKNNRFNVDGGHLKIRSTGPNAEAGTLACLPADSYSIYQTGGEVTIESGRFIGAANNQYYIIYGDGKGKMNIKGGRFENDYFQTLRFQGEGSELNISGGEFISQGKTKKGLADTLNEAIYITTGATVNATGGYATSLCAYGNSNVTLKDGFNADIVMKVSDGPSVVIDGCSFDKDVVLDAHSAGSVIDVKGGAYTNSIKVIGNGNVNILGGSFMAGTKAALVADGGTANINGGEFSASNNSGTVRAQAGGKVVVNDGKIEATASESGTVRALYAGDPEDNTSKGTITLNGGKVVSADQAVHLYAGDFVMTDGSIKAAGRLVCGNKGRTTMQITGGYLATDYTKDDVFTSEALYGSVFGGYFTRTFDANFLDPSVIIKEITPVVYDGITYNYQVVENEDVPDIISVNGKKFKSFEMAVDEANGYSEAGDVTLKLETTDTVEVSSTVRLANKNGKKIIFDLNGGVIKSMTDSLITVAGKLDIKDGKLVLASGKYKLLHIMGGGVVNTENCVFEDHSNYSNNNVHYYIICAIGTGTSNMAELNLKNGTKIVKASGWGYCLRVGYGFLTTAGTVEVTGHINPLSGDNYGKGAPLLYAHTGGKITINDGASFYSPGTGNAYVMNIATGNTNGFITINGGYFYGDQACIKESSSGYAKQVLTVNGGYFSHNFSSLNFMGGKTLTPCEVKHTHGDTELTYKYEAK